MNTSVYVWILLFNIAAVHTRSGLVEKIDEWESGYHPFPEMIRFLNPYSQIHSPTIRRTAHMRQRYSFLRYICSISKNPRRIEEVLLVFGEKYRPLINKIIEEDCAGEERKSKRRKRMTVNVE